MQQAATVKATVKGVAMVDPAQVGEKPRPGQGHLHYQVDDGPVIATTATKLSFHGLKPGAHKIMVVLAAVFFMVVDAGLQFGVTQILKLATAG